jgi:DNA-directed RNA polymerase subunit RPC12/RpoP
MVSYKCEKCNKEFNQKSNYLKHIHRKNPCIIIDNNIIIYKCEKCNKEFNHKTNYLYHINKVNSCNDINLQEKCNKLEIELFNLKQQNELLIKENNNTKELESKLLVVEKENSITQNKNIILEEENKRINELYNNLLDKCIKNNNIITNNNHNNITTNNTINITLTNFGFEKYTKLTNDEQIRILKSNKQCIANLIKFLHINDRLPEYKNICVKNLRGKGGYLYEGNKWLHCNFENLLMILFKNKINDLEKILNSNEGLISYNNNYIHNLIENYTDDMDTFIKNNKDNIINMLYNNTKNYKI